jgi:hypothetical protein
MPTQVCDIMCLLQPLWVLVANYFDSRFHTYLENDINGHS